MLQEPGAGVVAATVGRDVAFGLENTPYPASACPPGSRAALAAVRLDMPQDTPTHALSGGEQQRLALAGALALEPTGAAARRADRDARPGQRCGRPRLCR